MGGRCATSVGPRAGRNGTWVGLVRARWPAAIDQCSTSLIIGRTLPWGHRGPCVDSIRDRCRAEVPTVPDRLPTMAQASTACTATARRLMARLQRLRTVTQEIPSSNATADPPRWPGGGQ